MGVIDNHGERLPPVYEIHPACGRTQKLSRTDRFLGGDIEEPLQGKKGR